MCWSWVRAWESLQGVHGPCSGEGCSSLRRSLWTTLSNVKLNLLTHITTRYIHRLQFTNRRPYSLTCYLRTSVFVILPAACFLGCLLRWLIGCLLALRPPSSAFIYVRMTQRFQNLPRLDLSRTFLVILRVENGRECSGSFFTWLVGWVTDTPRRLISTFLATDS
jgi:hypothetical protein